MKRIKENLKTKVKELKAEIKARVERIDLSEAAKFRLYQKLILIIILVNFVFLILVLGIEFPSVFLEPKIAPLLLNASNITLLIVSILIFCVGCVFYISAMKKIDNLGVEKCEQ